VVLKTANIDIVTQDTVKGKDSDRSRTQSKDSSSGKDDRSGADSAPLAAGGAAEAEPKIDPVMLKYMQIVQQQKEKEKQKEVCETRSSTIVINSGAIHQRRPFKREGCEQMWTTADEGGGRP